MNNEYLYEIVESCLRTAANHKYISYDVSDLKRNSLFSFLNNIKSPFVKRWLSAPYDLALVYAPWLLRFFARNKGYEYPQAYALIIRSLILIQKNRPCKKRQKNIEEMLDWLLKNNNTDFNNPGWGQPFLWFSQKPFPANIPRATVSSQVAWAFIDMYELVGEERYLDVAKGVCRLFIEDFNQSKDQNGNLCFSYTTVDDYTIHNSSLMAAAVLARTYSHTKIEEFKEYAVKACSYSIQFINDDGSIGYASPPAASSTHFDSYHTGFVIEALQTISNDIPSIHFRSAYDRVLRFYIDNLFEGVVPRMTSKRTFPIDIQSCAQAVITFSLCDDEFYREKAMQICRYTIDNFYLSSRRHFAYRIYRSGFKDKSYYLRWGDAWMIRAIALLLSEDVVQ